MDRKKVQSAEQRARSTARTLDCQSAVGRSCQFAARRGVLLLLILALLAMFGLIGVTFVVMTGQAQRSAKSIEQIGQADSTTTDAHKLLQQAVMQALRGSNNPASVMGTHSLLEDIYGNEYLAGTTSTSVSATAVSDLPQLIYIPVGKLQVNGTTTEQSETAAADLIPRLSRHVGGVLTILDVPTSSTDAQKALIGQSTRIVSCGTNTATIQVLVFSNDAIPPQGTTFTINGMPFSGTGVGYNPTNGAFDLRYDFSTGSFTTNVTGTLSALLPNISPTVYMTDAAVPGVRNVRGNPPGGANEDYDAADFQNLLLAAQAPNITVGTITTLPSLHRPALIKYWMNNSDATPYTTFSSFWKSSDTNKALCRKIMLRPIGPMMANLETSSLGSGDSVDHPDFNGSNPNFNPIDNDTWDVDNDGDGKPDSVWVDLGMPVRTTSDGRAYKPLFAILCVDLDGRLNVNAHGCPAQKSTATTAEFLSKINAEYGPHVFASTATPALSHGLGYGPAEVVLSQSTVFTDWEKLLTYRYPDSGWIGGNAGHYLNLNRWFLYGDGDYWRAVTSGTANCSGAFGTPPDLAGWGGIGIDWGGRPIYCFMGQSVTSDLTVDACPYELDLSQTTRGTNTAPGNVQFSLGELERLLRPYDKDAPSLPDRLANLAAASAAAVVQARTSITTDSWDVPSATGALPAHIATTTNGATGGIVPVLQSLVMKAGSLGTQLSNDALATLFPPELLAGRKMDLNRAFGNGSDDDVSGSSGYNVVDQSNPTESESLHAFTYTTSGTGTTSGTISRYDPTRTAANSLQARQLYARYLYVLAMLLVDRDAVVASPQYKATVWPNGMNDEASRVPHFLAQWAVNVVDFYDSDSIMTPFLFDPNPFTATGWDTTTYHLGLPTSTDSAQHLVWGTERPELLISETLAFHDRRTEDTDLETTVGTETGDDQTQAGKTTDTTLDKKDASFDQRYVPQGSLFVELYNPWSDLEPRPYELCNAVNGGVDLTKKSGTAATDSPVWRLAIFSQGDSNKDPDDPASGATLQRTVYFTDTATTLPTDGAQVKFRPTTTMADKIAPILPGRYAVIGPGEPGDTTSSITFLGFKTGENPTTAAASPTTERRIVLTPSNSTATTGQVAIYNSSATANDVPDTTKIQNPTAVVINSPRRLNVSEPDGGYTTPSGVVDIPLDYNTSTAVPGTAIWNDGRTDCVAVVHLQRLANPLRPYDAAANPYRTIDSMPIDLTSFNGMTTTLVTTEGSVTKSIETKGGESLSANGALKFYARQRGANTSAITAHDLWTHEPLTSTNNAPQSNTVHVPATVASGFVFEAPLHDTLGYLNDPYGEPNTISGAIGDPSTTPFAWFTWNNRPFVSEMELMLAPWASSSQLLSYSIGTITSANNPYTDAASPFPRLLSFLQSPTSTVNGCQLGRLFEFVGVPSRFVGTDIQLNPSKAAAAATDADTANADPRFHFAPPFNRISNYRDPGKINLNTIYSKDVFEGLMAGRTKPTWENFLESRRGSSATSDTQLNLPTDVNTPTEFAHPFRSFTGAYLAPTSLAALQPLNDREINATVWREGSTAGTPLFEEYSTTNTYEDGTRNPYFRYQNLMRLGNLVTTRSNVYAMWITVGYFEVTPISGSYDQSIYPDGFKLGRELGSDTGAVERHRAFYIIDRTQPVGFQRGTDLNAEKAILVNRYIE